MLSGDYVIDQISHSTSLNETSTLFQSAQFDINICFQTVLGSNEINHTGFSGKLNRCDIWHTDLALVLDALCFSWEFRWFRQFRTNIFASICA
jgi:hypothetical protein